MKGYPSVHMDVRSSDEVVRGFQGMSAATRIDLLVRLLHQCLPLEVRFLGTVLQETALQSYEAMSTMESQVNRLNSYGDLGSIHDNPKRVCLSLALLRNENNTVATLLSRLLCAEGVVAGYCNTCSIEQFEEYRLMYVMALHHPAFCFRDKEPRLRSCLAELERALEERMAAQAGVSSALPCLSRMQLHPVTEHHVCQSLLYLHLFCLSFRLQPLRPSSMAHMSYPCHPVS